VKRRGSADVTDQKGAWARFRESGTFAALRVAAFALLVIAALVFAYYQTEL